LRAISAKFKFLLKSVLFPLTTLQKMAVNRKLATLIYTGM